MIELLPLFVAAAAAPQSACTAATLSYAGWKEAPGEQWDFHWPQGGGDPLVTILGVEHLRTPSHPQFARIVGEVERGRPTILFFEGPDRGIGADGPDTIARFGESGYVRFLAKERGLAVRSLEPSPPDQAKALLARFPADQVMLFFVLREAARLRDREGRTGAALDEAVATLLQRIQPMAAGLGIGSAFADVAALEAAAARYWPDRDWRSLPAAWFSPSADDRATGGLFLGAVNRADSEGRDRHMAELVLAAVKAGERPFVAVGRNHVPMLAPALECALPAATSGRGQAG